jgi:hypothetical protein
VVLLTSTQALLEQQSARVSSLEQSRNRDLAPAKPSTRLRVSKGKPIGRRPSPKRPVQSSRTQKQGRARKPK